MTTFSVSFEVAGTPVAKGRPKIVRWGKHVGMKTPEKTVNYESAIAWAASKAMGDRPPYEGMVEMTVFAYMPMPASMGKKKRAEAMDNVLRPVTKPDGDNLLKSAADGCNGVVFRDDKQAVTMTVHKYYSDRPRLEICVMSV